ncbi:MAG: hypothetical protein KBT89_16670, partial [Gammaproteobacteria bacterium]|nr:hypothetical protein [Gammaproteobacteria bacterium]
TTTNVENLTVSAGTGAVNFGGNIGSTTALRSVTISGATITLPAGVTTTADQSYTGAVTLVSNTILTTTTNGNILFPTTASTINATTAGVQSLSVNANGTGTIRYSGDIGTMKALSSISSTGGLTHFPAAITTTGIQSYTGPVKLVYNATLNTTNSNVSFVGATSIIDATTNGAQSLTVNAGAATITYGGEIGISEFQPTPRPIPPVITYYALSSLTSTGAVIRALDVKTTGNQAYTGTTTLNGNYTTTTGTFDVTGNTILAGGTSVDTSAGNQNITLGGTVTGAANTLDLSAGTGAVSITGAASGLASLTANGATVDVLGVASTGNQAYTGTTTLNGNYTTTTGTFDVTGNTILAGGTSV